MISNWAVPVFLCNPKRYISSDHLKLAVADVAPGDLNSRISPGKE